MLDIGPRIRAQRILRKWTQKDAAKHFSVDQSTISRWERLGNPEPEHLTAIAEFIGCTVDDILQPELTSTKIGNIPVVGGVEAGLWKEAVGLPQDEWRFVSVPEDDRYTGLPRFGLTVRGPSMNEEYPEGSTLLCIECMDMNRDPEDGERVIVYRYHKNGLVEATCKEFSIGEDGEHYLVPKSKDPRYKAPWKLHDGDPDVERIEVHAIVVGSYRPE